MIRFAFIISIFMLYSCDPKPIQSQPTGDNTTITVDSMLIIRK